MSATVVPRVGGTITAWLAIWAFVVYAVWQGVGIMLGGPERWNSPGFATLRLAPNPTIFWGTWLVSFGLLVGLGSLLRFFWLKAVGLIGIATWSILFAFGGLVAAATVPTASNTGGKTYVLIAAVAVILTFIDERRHAR